MKQLPISFPVLQPLRASLNDDDAPIGPHLLIGRIDVFPAQHVRLELTTHVNRTKYLLANAGTATGQSIVRLPLDTEYRIRFELSLIGLDAEDSVDETRCQHLTAKDRIYKLTGLAIGSTGISDSVRLNAIANNTLRRDATALLDLWIGVRKW